MSQVKLTIPDEICEKLKVMAKEEDRSLNNYIYRVLKEHVQVPTSDTSATDTSATDTSATNESKPIRRKSIIGNDNETKNIWEGEDPRWYQ